MSDFKTISSDAPIKEVIQSAFDTDLAVSGGWGYNKELATVIQDTKGMPIDQFEHTLTTMRAYIEMNMTLEQKDRYGSINPKEIAREEIVETGLRYDKVTYEVSAMKENIYASFINEYKENAEKPDFDLADHFNRRKEATLKRTVEHWFERSAIDRS